MWVSVLRLATKPLSSVLSLSQEQLDVANRLKVLVLHHSSPIGVTAENDVAVSSPSCFNQTKIVLEKLLS